jgi:hypothetical protein
MAEISILLPMESVVEYDSNQNRTSRSLRRKAISDVGSVHCFTREGRYDSGSGKK